MRRRCLARRDEGELHGRMHDCGGATTNTELYLGRARGARAQEVGVFSEVKIPRFNRAVEVYLGSSEVEEHRTPRLNPT